MLTSEGATSRLLDRWQDGAFELVVCPRLVYEVRKALLSPRLADRYDIAAHDAEGFARKLTEESFLLEDPTDPPRVVPDDQDDDYLVALVLASRSDVLGTRDRHFEKVDLHGLRIVDPRDALVLLDS